VNCLHEIFFDAAIADAKKLDAYFAEHGSPIGPLHGLPISLKDQFHVKNVDTTMGYVGWIGTFQGKKGDARYRNYESELEPTLVEVFAFLLLLTACVDFGLALVDCPMKEWRTALMDRTRSFRSLGQSHHPCLHCDW
jgi:hypothetical protein